ncbi:PKD-like domain-containing protein [Taibaiella soli]|uniref:PKD-like domain-containing protein n=1 Tax=Taibaiella soli TaxID=1649169 RepID=A0A2W2BW56_9BACT|nr:PKD-like domain-containing protein [Taibaiella soli]PZF72073.1 hypothetical protein DN068_14130 [Taibaiella soli]
MKNIIKGAFLIAAVALLSGRAMSQTSVGETCMGSTPSNSNFIIGGNARLTADSGIDAVGAGYLRLTNAYQNQNGYGYINQAFPSNTGFVAEFEFESWGKISSTPADGISVFLFDGSYGPGTFTLGSFGGGLGYAGNFNSAAPLSGGYAAVGLDEWGNFSSQVFATDPAPGRTTHSVVIRGRSADSTPYLTGVPLTNTALNTKWFDYGTATVRPPQSAYFRKARVAFLYNSVLGKYQISVYIQESLNGPMVQVIQPYILNSPPPSTLKIGFAASTGQFASVHEIRNIQVSSPAQIRVVKTGNASVLPGGAMTYSVNVYNDDMTDISGVNFTELLPANFTPSGNPTFTPVTAGNALASGSYSGGNYNGTLTLKANSYATLTFTGTANFSSNSDDSLNNTAIAKAPAGYLDAYSTDDTSRVTTYRIPVASSSSTTICGNTTPTGVPTSDVTGTQYTWTSVLTSGTVTGLANNATPAAAISNTLTNTLTTPGIVTYTMTPVMTYKTPTGNQVVSGTPTTYTVTVNPAPVVSSISVKTDAPPALTLIGNIDGLATALQWQKNGVNISGATNSSFVNPHYNKNIDDGMYTIVANNTYNCPASAQVNLVAPLPLKLVSFTGSRNNNTDNLSWVTAEEKDVNHFEVEYSNDGGDFILAGSVNMNTDAALTHKYSFVYDAVGTAYYRLKIIDNDQKVSYSNVVKLNGKTADAGTVSEMSINGVAPIPFNSMLSVEINSSTDVAGKMEIIGVNGTTLVIAKISLAKGAGIYTINGLEQLPSGIYILRVTTADNHTAIYKISK